MWSGLWVLHRGALLSQFLRQACRDRAEATHITDTNSGHEIHKDQPQLVIDSSPERFWASASIPRQPKRAHLAATEACHRELAATGADLSAYNSTESAPDFADLREVLGYAAWNVYWGTSHGAFLAQTLMREHPEAIRSVILDSVLPSIATIPGFWLNTHAGFDNLFQACAAEPACSAAHPVSRNLHRTGQQTRGPAADDDR
jgi:pimeloyl-ACP methyl ester carboxylesterase